METSVSIVAAEMPRVHRQRRDGNGNPAQRTIGVESASATHFQPGELERRHHRDQEERHGERERNQEAAAAAVAGTAIGPAAGISGAACQP